MQSRAQAYSSKCIIQFRVNVVHMVNLDELDQQLAKQFALNLSALQEFMPDLYQRFCHYKPLASFDLIPCADGFDVQFLNDHSRLYNLDHPHASCQTQATNFINYGTLSCSKVKAGKDFINQIHMRYLNEIVEHVSWHCNFRRPVSIKDLGCCPNLIVFGCGLGYLIESLYSSLEIYSMVVIEPNPDLFYASLYTTNYHGLLHFIHEQGYHLKFMLGDTLGDLHDYLSDLRIYFNHIGSSLTASFWTIVHYHSLPIDYLVQTFKQEHTSMFEQGGFFDDSLFALSHTFANLQGSYLGSSVQSKSTQSPPKRLENLFLKKGAIFSAKIRDYPVFIVGSGPSLSQDLAFLQSNQDKAVIIACGSAIEVLYKAKIKPTFLACVERLAHIVKIFEQIDDPNFLQDVILLTTELSHPQVLTYFKHKLLCLKAMEAPYLVLKHIKEDVFTQYAALNYITPLVSNLAVHFALSVGFQSVYLFGLDHGTLHKELRHDEQCDFYQDLGNLYTEQDLFNLKFQVQRNFPTKEHAFAYTCPLYLTAVDLLNKGANYLQKHKVIGIEVGKLYNCSDGVFINCALPLHSNQIDLTQYSGIDKVLLWKEIESVHTLPLVLSPSLVSKLEQALDLRRYQEYTNKLITRLQKKDYSKDKISFIAWLSQIESDLSKLQNTDEVCIYAVLKDSLRYYFKCLNHLVFFITDPEQSFSEIERCLDLITYFLADSQKLYAYLPQYYAGEHLHFVKDKVGWDHPLSIAPNIELTI